MSNSPNLQLPYLDANQNQKTVTHNAALTALDALVNCQVQSAALTAPPPSSPGDGQCWIVGPSATGAWAGKDLNIAAWQDGAWSFYPPTKGMLAFNDAAAALLVWNGAAWANLNSLLALLMVTALGVGTAPDTGNPLSATLNAALFNALATGSGGTGDVRVKLNKQAVGNTASFLFQDGFAGRAEIGLCGDDSFHVKVSPDGATWTDAIKIAAADGSVSVAGTINSSTGTTGFSLAQRAAITTQAVPMLRPTSVNTSIALDIMPNGVAVPAFSDIIAWLDVCDADVANNTSTPLNYLRFAARTAVLEIGSSSLYGGTGKPISFTYGGTEKMRLGSSGINVGAATANTNGLLQINGNTAPPATTTLSGKVGLELVGPNAANYRQLITTYGAPGFVDFTRYDGTQASPTALAAVDTIGQIEWNGYNGTAVANAKASIVAAASENWTTSANGTYLSMYTTPATTTTVTEVARFTGTGLDQTVIGATTPAQATFSGATVSAFGGSAFSTFKRANGTLAAPTAVTLGQVIGNFPFNGYDGAAYAFASAALKVMAAENVASGHYGGYVTISTNAVGGGKRRAFRACPLSAKRWCVSRYDDIQRDRPRCRQSRRPRQRWCRYHDGCRAPGGRNGRPRHVRNQLPRLQRHRDAGRGGRRHGRFGGRQRNHLEDCRDQHSRRCLRTRPPRAR